MTTTSASSIVEALASKHWKDVFVPECKDGPTQSGSHLRLDAWAMRRSWSSPMTWGYEVKVSRSDFVRDDKYEAYRPLVRSLSLVAPKGLIAPGEVPAGVGLIEMLGSRLVTRVKSAPSPDPPPEETNVLRYILMCRVTVGRERWETKESRRDEWKAWLEQKEEDKRIGYNVSKAMQAKYERDVARVEHENRTLQATAKAVQDAYNRLSAAGLLSSWLSTQEVSRRANATFQGVDPQLPVDLRHAAKRLTDLADAMDPAISVEAVT